MVLNGDGQEHDHDIPIQMAVDMLANHGLNRLPRIVGMGSVEDVQHGEQPPALQEEAQQHDALLARRQGQRRHDRGRPRRSSAAAVISSAGEGESDSTSEEREDHNDGDDDDDDRIDLRTNESNDNPSSKASTDEENLMLLYDDQADEEDEAYVYKYLRSGIEETIPVIVRQSLKSEPTAVSGSFAPYQQQAQQEKQQYYQQEEQQRFLSAYKLRRSDAVLSCPCCFQTVCMDCQRHERYANQYRAMFVMNIIVAWDRMLRHDDKTQMLVPVVLSPIDVTTMQQQQPQMQQEHQDRELPPPTPPATAIPDDDDDDDDLLPSRMETDGEHVQWQGLSNSAAATDDDNAAAQNTLYPYYFTVCCASCGTVVAALDMNEEVYHFYGCAATA